MASNYSNFNDFLNLKSPDLYALDSPDYRNNDFLKPESFSDKLDFTTDFMINIEGHQDEHRNEYQEILNNSENLSTSSNPSTNYSSKNSPDYQQYEQESSGKSDNQAEKRSQVPPILKKTIHKDYEPIMDGNLLYKYEDDPVEYKKARKRIQNRESASRVRSRKKNYVVEVEQDVCSLKKDNADLQVKNAALTAENNLLKQQITFLEKMLMKSNSSYTNTAAEPSKNSKFILPMQKTTENIDPCMTDEVEARDNEPKQDFGFVRMTSGHPFKRHATILGVVTLLIVAFGIVTNDSVVNTSNGSVSLDDFTKSISISLQAINAGQTSGLPNETLSMYQQQMEQSIYKYMENQERSLTSQICRLLLGALYAMYFGYVCLVAKRTVFRGKIKYF